MAKRQAALTANAALLDAPAFGRATAQATAKDGTVSFFAIDLDGMYALNLEVGRPAGDRFLNAVVGTLTNRGGEQIHDIRLLIDIPFLWANEVKPGQDSPGRSSVLTVQGPLAPHGELAFEFTPNPPLPERTDGHFGDPQVHVMGFTSVGTP